MSVPAGDDLDTQVIVVGAGPVGLMLAAELRLGGADVVVLERLTAPSTASRASTLHARTMEIFDQRGLLDRIGAPPHEPMSHFGGLRLDLRHSPSRFAGQWKVPQTRVEQVLAEWAGELGADLRRGYEVTDVEADAEGVRVRAVGALGPVWLRAAYVVGCDGEGSTVRQRAGIGADGMAPTRRLLRADVAGIEVPNRRFERLPNGLAIAARRPDGVTRVMVAVSDEPVDTGPVREPEFADVVRAWKQVTGEDIGGGEPLWVNAFDNTSHQADRYRSGRVLLAGDAAHQQMPVGGQAMNLGLQDAVNLGWKLAAVVRGSVTDRLLDTYHDERHAVGRRVLGNIRAQSLLLLGGREVDAVRELVGELMEYPVVRDRLAGMISGLDVRYGDDPDPLVGARAPHWALRLDDGGSGTTTELLRTGRGVLLDLSADASRRAWLAGILSDPSGPRPRQVDLVAATAPFDVPDTLLIRPDGYVAWTGDRQADPRAALNRWFGPDPS